jgi:hypothetical protein
LDDGSGRRQHAAAVRGARAALTTSRRTRARGWGARFRRTG